MIVNKKKWKSCPEMRDMIGIYAIGWVPHERQLQRSKEVIQQIKAGLMEHSNTETKMTALLAHFPFDDHDKDV